MTTAGGREGMHVLEPTQIHALLEKAPAEGQTLLLAAVTTGPVVANCSASAGATSTGTPGGCGIRRSVGAALLVREILLDRSIRIG